MCSEPLEKAIVDFGADVAFGKVPQKLEEHYGIKIPESTAKRIVYKHAKIMSQGKKDIAKNKKTEARCIFGSADGVMVPIVNVNKDENKTDLRKSRSTCWKEVRLALGCKKGSISPSYAAVIGSTDEAGDILEDCIKREGLGDKTFLHIVADGAPWIEEQVEKHFGSKAKFLIDFYHVSEYLAEAGKCCCPEDPKGWLKSSQDCMKESNIERVFSQLRSHTNEKCPMGKDCPAKKCLNYLEKRVSHLDYKSALEQDLPIGSGAIESGNRHVIQARLKISGAWWKKENVQPMLDLRTLRANGDWNLYWQDKRLGYS